MGELIFLREGYTLLRKPYIHCQRWIIIILSSTIYLELLTIELERQQSYLRPLYGCSGRMRLLLVVMCYNFERGLQKAIL